MSGTRKDSMKNGDGAFFRKAAMAAHKTKRRGGARNDKFEYLDDYEEELSIEEEIEALPE